MRTVSDEYLAQVQGSGRQFGFYIKVYGNSQEGDTLWLGDIISIDILRSISDKLQIGACLSDKLTLQTRATTLFGGKGKKIEVYYRCTAPVLPWSKLGTFYVDEAVTKEGVTAVTAYDMMGRLDKKISWVDTSKATAPTFPCKMQAMLKYICDRCGFTTDFTCENITVEKAPDGYTARELISYIAASHGANARFSPSEVLKFVAYSAVDKTVESGRCYSLDIGEDYTVKGLLFNKDSNTKVYIDGTSKEYDEDADGIVEVFDPFATVAISEYAWNRLGGLSYSAASLEMPAENILEPGDVFTVLDTDGTEKTVIVMEQQLTVSCTGGFVEKISCEAESKKQTRNSENRAEATEKEAKNSEKLKSPDGNSYAAMMDTGELMIFKGGAPVMYLLNSGGMIGFQEAGSRCLLFDEHGGISLNNGKAGVCHLDIGATETRAVRVETDGVDGAYPRSIFQLAYGAKLFANADGLAIGDKFRIVLTSGGFRLERTDTTCTLEAMSDGLYYNGVKIGG